LIFREKKVRGFFWGAFEVPIKLQIFKKYWKNKYRRVAYKRVQFLHQAPQITLFLTHPVVNSIFQLKLRWPLTSPLSKKLDIGIISKHKRPLTKTVWSKCFNMFSALITFLNDFLNVYKFTVAGNKRKLEK